MFHGIKLIFELLGYSIADLVIELADILDIFQPVFVFDIENALQIVSGKIMSGRYLVIKIIKVYIFRIGDIADLGFSGVHSAGAAVDYPFQNSEVFPEARPDIVTVFVQAEPVYIKDFGQLIRVCLFAHIQPMLKIISHIIAAEGQHGHGVPAHDPHCAGGSGGGFGSHD